MKLKKIVINYLYKKEIKFSGRCSRNFLFQPKINDKILKYMNEKQNNNI